jgi:hypothetical protein
LLVVLGTCAGGIAWLHHRADTKAQQLLLVHTDHHALLAACREVLTRQGRDRRPDPKDPALPAAIRAMAPARVVVDETSVTLVVPTPIRTLFVVGFAKGVHADESVRGRVNARPLVDGLWYYEDEEE